ncbi:glycosyl hydrolase family 8 [Aliiglaciecola sp. CAU 1673]|uniref:glycosyl hydrolase family 8 n=1 Tax=Aliiglaciecola sp. CAU 1673 TaxID=3032595 RepID=UPI0023DC2AC4|nr:glycosyl hydrolase family 8 [Aliiglaciecola sp. CAU 1673]MDF2179654.1 glycosyl hydrolase family 8 [Aliiglaciecola sp. CAU 1673]
MNGSSKSWWAALIIMFLAGCQPAPSLLPTKSWQAFSQAYIEQGRVVDKDNQGVSHSEGQGYGMLMAEAASDRNSFDILWGWTKQNLQRDDNLFSWQYRPCPAQDSDCISDPNNASDGDVLIAWALLRAAKRWNSDDYEREAEAIIQAIAEKLIIQYQDYWLLVPGEYGFKDPNRVTVNLSYWVFPAFKAFAQRFPEQPWQQLIDSGKQLILRARFGSQQLNPDWLDISENGLSVSERYPPQYGFNACRIPLHLVWANIYEEELLAPYLAFWQQPSPPAWIDLTQEEQAPYAWSAGKQAIAQTTLQILGKAVASAKVPPEVDDRYFSSALSLLSHIAAQEVIHGQG